MRVITALVLAGWMLGSVAAPCAAWNTCARTARHECCCGSAGHCCCRLTSHGAPASASHVTVLTMAPDPLGQPAVEAAPLCGLDPAPHHHASLAADLAVAGSPPLYLSARSIRC